MWSPLFSSPLTSRHALCNLVFFCDISPCYVIHPLSSLHALKVLEYLVNYLSWVCTLTISKSAQIIHTWNDLQPLSASSAFWFVYHLVGHFLHSFMTQQEEGSDMLLVYPQMKEAANCFSHELNSRRDWVARRCWPTKSISVWRPGNET